MCYYVWYLLEHKHHIFHGFVTFYGLHLHGTIKIAQFDDWSEILKKSVLWVAIWVLYVIYFFLLDICFEEMGSLLYTFYLIKVWLVLYLFMNIHFYLSLVNFIARWLFLLLCTIFCLVYLCPVLKVMSFGGVLQDYFS